MALGKVFAFETGWDANCAADGPRFRLWAPGVETVELAAGPDETGERVAIWKRRAAKASDDA